MKITVRRQKAIGTHMSIEVSVIIPTYNRAGLIPFTLDSILRQSHRPSEVIVVDDGSKDDTKPRVKLLRHLQQLVFNYEDGREMICHSSTSR